MKSSLLRSFLVGAILALSSGCSTAPSVKTHAEPTVSYSNFASFAMLRPIVVPVAANSVVTPTLVRLVRAEAGSAFRAKGLVEVSEEQADVHVLVHGGVRDRIDIRPSALPVARLGAGVRNDVEQYSDGSILVDVFDAKTGALVWRGSVVAHLNGDPDPQKVAEAVSSIVASYPG